MIVRLRPFVSFIAFVLFSIAAAGTAAHAQTLYTSGAVDGQDEAWKISDPYSEAQSFTISNTSSLTGVDFTAWTDPGATTSSLDWAIATTPFGTALDSGSSTVSGNVPLGAPYGVLSNGLVFDVDNDTFSFGSPFSLTAGTYYLELSSAVSSDGGAVSWDQNSGTSSGEYQYNPDPSITGPVGSLTFSVLGVPSVPEPSPTIPFLIGAAGLAALVVVRSRGRSKTAA